MLLFIGCLLAVSSVLLGWAIKVSELGRRILDGVAVIALFVLFILVAETVMRTIIDGTVFMTNVHSVLLNKAFLVSGAYLGPYSVAKTALLVLIDSNKTK